MRAQQDHQASAGRRGRTSARCRRAVAAAAATAALALAAAAAPASAAAGYTVIATIPVASPAYVAVDPATRTAYVTDVATRIATGMDETLAGKAITADVPLSEMFGYATTVRSMSQGRATFTMEFSKYLEVPPNIADGIIKQ